jgi:hypothetical protein
MSGEETKPCPICGGSGRIVIDDLQAAPCRCLRFKMQDVFLGPDFATAPHVGKAESPLYQTDGGSITKAPVVDRTTENLFLKITWLDFRMHARWSLGCRYWRDQTFRYRMVTDERLLSVWLGDEKYTSKSKKTRDRDDTQSYNSLRDLVENFDLVIIRLGHIGYKNIAAPGVLRQALMIREVALKPTWIVQVPTPGGAQPVSWDSDVALYVDEHFDILDFMRHGGPAPAPVAKPAMDVESTQPEPPAEEEAMADLVPSDSADPVGQKRTGKGKPGWKKDWRKRGGGGPVGGLNL